MPPTIPPNGCRGNNAQQGQPCPLQCRYNLFQRDALRIDSWELKCRDCGYRATQACRSDDPAAAEIADPGQCPWCGLQGAASGINPCLRP